MRKMKRKGYLEIIRLSKEYGEVKALREVKLTVPQGQWLTVMGPSGSGKTTLLSLIAGLIKPTRGKVKIGGVDIFSLSDNQLLQFRREKIGLIFQQHHLIPYLTALENVMLAQFIHSLPDEAEAIDSLIKVGLADKINRYPRELSGGEQQRVCIARALINNPGLLLADEPTGNLDRKNSELVLNLLSKLHQESNFTIVLVTHDPWVARWGERIVQLEDGKVVDDFLVQKSRGRKR